MFHDVNAVGRFSLCTPYQADGAGDNDGDDGAAKTLLDGTRKKGVAKSVEASPAEPAAPAAPGGEESDDCDDVAWYGFLEIEGLEAVTGQSSSKNKRNKCRDGIRSKTNKKIGHSSTTADAVALATDTGGSSGGGVQGYSNFLSPSGDDGSGVWDGTKQRTPPRTSRSPAGSPGLTPLRGRSRRGWWRRRRDKYPTAN